MIEWMKTHTETRISWNRWKDEGDMSEMTSEPTSRSGQVKPDQTNLNIGRPTQETLTGGGSFILHTHVHAHKRTRAHARAHTYFALHNLSYLFKLLPQHFVHTWDHFKKPNGFGNLINLFKYSLLTLHTHTQKFCHA